MSRVLIILSLCIMFLFVSVAKSQEEQACTSLALIEGSAPTELHQMASAIVVYDNSLRHYRFLDWREVVTTVDEASIDVPIDSVTPIAIQQRSISPDGTRILYLYYVGSEAFLAVTPLLASDDTITITHESWQDSANSASWLASNVIIVHLSGDIHDYNYSIVSTNDTEIIDNNLHIDDDWTHAPVLSPDQRLIAYTRYFPRTEEGDNLDDDLVIFNVETNAVLNHVLLPGIDGINYIRWDPTSNYVSFSTTSIASNQIGVVNTNGQVLFNTEVDTLRYTRWSPNGDLLLYWDGALQFQNVIAPYPNILNVHTGEVTSICLPGNAIWSPNGGYIAIFPNVEVGEGLTGEILGAFIYEVSSGYLYELNTPDLDTVNRILGWGDVHRIGSPNIN